LSNPALQVLSIALPVGLVIIVVYALTGFNYVESFLLASEIESAKYGGGLYMMSAPLSYAITRIENVGGIILFFGPYCTFIAYKGARLPTESLVKFGWYAGIVTLALFAVGTPRTGETARIFLLLLPFMLLFVANYFSHERLGFREWKQLAALVWVQAVLMQLFGNYLW
jgi:hypothetical protein